MTKQEEEFTEMIKTGKFELPELARLIDEISNNYSFGWKEIGDELHGSKAMLGLAATWIAYWQNEPLPGYFERNTYALEACKRIWSNPDFRAAADPILASEDGKRFAGLMYVKYASYSSAYLKYMHRTLMQTFTKFVLYFIDGAEVFAAAAEKEREERPEYYRLPMV